MPHFKLLPVEIQISGKNNPVGPEGAPYLRVMPNDTLTPISELVAILKSFNEVQPNHQFWDIYFIADSVDDILEEIEE